MLSLAEFKAVVSSFHMKTLRFPLRSQALVNVLDNSDNSTLKAPLCLR